MSGFSFGDALMQSDPLESLPLILLGGIGLLGIPAGLILTAASVAWRGLTHRP